MRSLTESEFTSKLHAEFEQRAALPVSFERTVKTKGKLLHVA